MTYSPGCIRFHPLFTCADIGVHSDAGVDQIIRRFLEVGEAIATRWIEMPKGILLFQTVPDVPDSGAIYLYDRARRIFFLADFSNCRDDSFTPLEFEQLTADYNLVSIAAHPELLSGTMAQPGRA